MRQCDGAGSELCCGDARRCACVECAVGVLGSIHGSEKKFEMRLRMGPRARPGRDSSIREVEVAIMAPAITTPRAGRASEKSRIVGHHMEQRPQRQQAASGRRSGAFPVHEAAGPHAYESRLAQGASLAPAVVRSERLRELAAHFHLATNFALLRNSVQSAWTPARRQTITRSPPPRSHHINLPSPRHCAHTTTTNTRGPIRDRHCA